MLIYAWDLDERTHYFTEQSEAQEAFDVAAQEGGFPEWREPAELLGLLDAKDQLLGEFAKRIAFLELSLERAELKGNDFDLGAE
ncbi:MULTISPECIES: hypothetical protein [Aliagarivorans]|uniref:hypothetical protein n=1 Tax=Aliagarivorans TaxID=882379 RepID=UPI000411B265|nr:MULTISPECIES: hypothetical protein [Aliagarivorans]